MIINFGADITTCPPHNGCVPLIWVTRQNELKREKNLARVLIAKELDKSFSESWLVRDVNSFGATSNDFRDLLKEAKTVVLDIVAYHRFRGPKNELLNWLRYHPQTALYISDIERASLDIARHFKFVFGEAGYLLPSYPAKPHCFLPHASSPLPTFPETLHNNILIPQRHGLDNPTEYVRNFYSQRISMATIAAKCPGVVVQKHFCESDTYQVVLGSYLGCFVTLPSKSYPNLVAKFFEVPASGSLLVAYTGSKREIFESIGWKDGVNYCEVTPSTIEETIAFVLNPANRALIEKIRRAGYDLVSQRHTVKHRTADFIKMIEGEFISP